MQRSTAICEVKDEESEIDLTPMLDVVFIMLIFFIVTASFIKEAGIDVNRPDAPMKPLTESGSILIDIGENNEIWMGRRLVDPRAVRANIERMHAEDPNATVVIQADRRSFGSSACILSIFGQFGTGDGPLINIIRVQPLYPAIAATRGLDGTVTVQFDVSEIGTVENVTVIHSTNRIFNKAAIDAAYRFKYKPKVIDGTRYRATGLQQLFRFEMEK